MKSLAPIVLLALAACTTAAQPVRVTRFAARPDLPKGPVAAATVPSASLEQRSYDAAIADALARAGFPTTDGPSARYLYTLEVTRDVREGPPRRSPVTIGLGGGTGGYGGGVGLGASFGIGKRKSSATASTYLTLRLSDRATGTTVWEGSAKSQGPDGSDRTQPVPTVQRMADALLRDFPGQSGRTISVP